MKRQQILALGNLLELTLAGREPGEKTQVTRKGVKLHWLAEGALQVTPPPGQGADLDLLLSAGVHGNEVTPIQVLDRLIRSIACGEVVPRVRLLLLFANPTAMRRGVRHLEVDLNRLFSGAHASARNIEATRAAELEQLVAAFFGSSNRRRRHYDLHSAMRASQLNQFAICPWREGSQATPAALQRLQAAGIEGVLFQQRPANTFSAYTAIQHAVQAFTLELAQGEDNHGSGGGLERFERSLQLCCAGEETLPNRRRPPLQLFSVAREIVKRTENFRLCLPKDIENFAPLALGTVLAEEGGGRRWVVEEPQARILFPMPQVAVGQRAGLIVVPC